MGKYKVLSRDSWSNTRKFLVDTENDLNILPKNIGSTALVAETSDEYILNNKKEWVKIKKDSSNNNENNSGNETVNNDNEAIFIEKEDGGQWPDTFPMSMQELTERALSGTLPKVYIKYVTGSSSAKWLAIRECIPSFAFKYARGTATTKYISSL